MKKWMSYAVVILWLAAAAKYIAGGPVTGETQVTRAFSQAEFLETECSLSMTGYLGEADYSGERRAEVLREIANELGLYTQYTMGESVQRGMQITEFFKEMPAARVHLRLVTVDNVAVSEEARPDNYLYIKLDFYQSSESGLYYKEKLEQLAAARGLDTQVTLTLTGVFAGELDLAARDAVASQLLESLGAHEQEAYRETELYTIYAYTDAWEEQTQVNGKPINVNLAFSYDETRDQTYVYLGSPLILNEY